MFRGRQERARFREELIEALRRYARGLVAGKPDIKLVVLYGSFSRGDWREGSDADLLIVAEDLPASYAGRWDLFRTSVMGVPVEPHALTVKEFWELLEHGRMAVADALTEGVVLYADEAFLAGTAAEITPVREVDGRPLGEGRPGPITRRLQQLFFQAVRGRLPQYEDWLCYL